MKNEESRVQLGQEILPDAEESVRLMSEGFQQGQLNLLELLAARQVFFESSLAYAEALTELHKVSAEIKGLQLTGGLNPAEIGTAIQGAGGNAGRQRAILNNVQQNTASRLLPAALQTGR